MSNFHETPELVPRLRYEDEHGRDWRARDMARSGAGAESCEEYQHNHNGE